MERRKTGTYDVVDQSGRRLVVEEFTTYERGRVIGSNAPVPVAVEYELPDGTHLKGFIGGQQFVNERTGELYKRV